jgi:hypothetical protein
MCGTQDRSVRDLLMHLHSWHEMLIKWYRDNTAGKETAFLPEGFGWRDTPKLNAGFWEDYQGVSLEEAEKLVRKSHGEVMDIIKGCSNDELFEKGVYKWTGGTTLGAYFVSATSSHYEWAIKLLKKM